VAPIPIPAIAIPSASPRRSSNHADTAFAYAGGAWPVLMRPQMPASVMNTNGDEGVNESAAVESANRGMKVRVTRRIPCRSIARPMNG
jgi:hypothetical protein